MSEVFVFGIKVDGERDEEYGGPLAVQGIQTGFGDPGSELDAAYAIVSEGMLYLMITGNLEPNFNKLEIFIDSNLLISYLKLMIQISYLLLQRKKFKLKSLV